VVGVHGYCLDKTTKASNGAPVTEKVIPAVADSDFPLNLSNFCEGFLCPFEVSGFAKLAKRLSCSLKRGSS
jgi:hypothetical protein